MIISSAMPAVALQPNVCPKKFMKYLAICRWLLWCAIGIFMGHAPARSFEIDEPLKRAAKVSPPLAEYDLSRLSAPKTPEEFIGLLREISENFLLLDPKFQSDENLQRLFGPGVFSTNEGRQNSDWHQMKTLEIDKASVFRDWVGESIFFSYAKYPDSGKKSASLAVHNLNTSSPIHSHLVETVLVPKAIGRDPLNDWALLTNEALTAAALRPQRTDSKGYYAYHYHAQTARIKESISVDLHGNGSIFRVEIDQKEI